MNKAFSTQLVPFLVLVAALIVVGVYVSDTGLDTNVNTADSVLVQADNAVVEAAPEPRVLGELSLQYEVPEGFQEQPSERIVTLVNEQGQAIQFLVDYPENIGGLFPVPYEADMTPLEYMSALEGFVVSQDFAVLESTTETTLGNYTGASLIYVSTAQSGLVNQKFVLLDDPASDYWLLGALFSNPSGFNEALQASFENVITSVVIETPAPEGDDTADDATTDDATADDTTTDDTTTDDTTTDDTTTDDATTDDTSTPVDVEPLPLGEVFTNENTGLTLSVPEGFRARGDTTFTYLELGVDSMRFMMSDVATVASRLGVEAPENADALSLMTAFVEANTGSVDSISAVMSFENVAYADTVRGGTSRRFLVAQGGDGEWLYAELKASPANFDVYAATFLQVYNSIQQAPPADAPSAPTTDTPADGVSEPSSGGASGDTSTPVDVEPLPLGEVFTNENTGLTLSVPEGFRARGDATFTYLEQGPDVMRFMTGDLAAVASRLEIEATENADALSLMTAFAEANAETMEAISEVVSAEGVAYVDTTRRISARRFLVAQGPDGLWLYGELKTSPDRFDAFAVTLVAVYNSIQDSPFPLAPIVGVNLAPTGVSADDMGHDMPPADAPSSSDDGMDHDMPSSDVPTTDAAPASDAPDTTTDSSDSVPSDGAEVVETIALGEAFLNENTSVSVAVPVDFSARGDANFIYLEQGTDVMRITVHDIAFVASRLGVDVPTDADIPLALLTRFATATQPTVDEVSEVQTDGKYYYVDTLSGSTSRRFVLSQRTDGSFLYGEAKTTPERFDIFSATFMTVLESTQVGEE